MGRSSFPRSDSIWMISQFADILTDNWFVKANRLMYLISITASARRRVEEKIPHQNGMVIL